MQYLIDAHVFLWFASNAKNLSQIAKPNLIRINVKNLC